MNEHQTRRQILMKLQPRMGDYYGEEIKDAYNAQLAANRRARRAERITDALMIAGIISVLIGLFYLLTH
jgi:hypothetical protein